METLSTYEKQFQGQFARGNPEGNVINFPKYPLTKNQLKVLNKNFWPTPGYKRKKERKKERNLKWQTKLQKENQT